MIADRWSTASGRLGTCSDRPPTGLKPDVHDHLAQGRDLGLVRRAVGVHRGSDKVWRVLEQGTDQFGPFGHGWTYSAHPIGAAAGVANLKLLDSLGLVQNAGEVGPYLTRTMAEAVGRACQCRRGPGRRGC